jgi:hypothetical protein
VKEGHRKVAFSRLLAQEAQPRINAKKRESRLVVERSRPRLHLDDCRLI